MRTTFRATSCSLWILFLLKSHAVKAQHSSFCGYLTLAKLGKPLIQVLHKTVDCFTSNHQGIEFKLWTGKMSEVVNPLGSGSTTRWAKSPLREGYINRILQIIRPPLSSPFSIGVGPSLVSFSNRYVTGGSCLSSVDCFLASISSPLFSRSPMHSIVPTNLKLLLPCLWSIKRFLRILDRYLCLQVYLETSIPDRMSWALLLFLDVFANWIAPGSRAPM